MVVEGKEGEISVAVAGVSSVRGKPKPRATTGNFHRGASIWQQEEEEEAPHGAATTSHTFSPSGLLTFPGRQGKSLNPNVDGQSRHVYPLFPR